MREPSPVCEQSALGENIKLRTQDSMARRWAAGSPLELCSDSETAASELSHVASVRPSTQIVCQSPTSHTGYAV